jgi:hypothetical protein
LIHTIKSKVQAVAVERLVIGTLTLKRLISAAYKSVSPKNPTGKKRPDGKIMAPATATADGWLAVPAKIASSCSF